MKCEFTKDELQYIQNACALYDVIKRELGHQERHSTDTAHQQINDKLVRYIYPGNKGE